MYRRVCIAWSWRAFCALAFALVAPVDLCAQGAYTQSLAGHVADAEWKQIASPPGEWIEEEVDGDFEHDVMIGASSEYDGLGLTVAEDAVPDTDAFAPRAFSAAPRLYGRPVIGEGAPMRRWIQDVEYVDNSGGSTAQMWSALSGGCHRPGDLNCDGWINSFDIDPFVLALTDVDAYYVLYPDCDHLLADINDDGSVNTFDIDPFVALLVGEYGESMWTQFDPALSPDARWACGLAYDNCRDVTVLFGGADRYTLYGETWEWDGASWAIESESGPDPRYHPAMAFDTSRCVTVLFGGQASGEHFGDTWEWDGTEWQLVSETGPLPRTTTAMVYDRANGVSVLFGGYDGSGLGDCWYWDGTTWTPGPEGPPARWYHAMAYDTEREVVVLYGGWGVEQDAPLSDTWELDDGAWHLVPECGPPPLYEHALSYDICRQRTVLFGGNLGGVQSSEAWEWDGAEWHFIANGGPSPRWGHCFAYDELRQESLMFGGSLGGYVYGDDTWAYRGTVPEDAIAYWSFDNPEDPGHDDSGYGHQLRIPGTWSTADTVCGDGIAFDGYEGDGPFTSTDRLDYPGTGGFTVAFWALLEDHDCIMQDYWLSVANGQTFSLWYEPTATPEAIVSFYARHAFAAPTIIETPAAPYVGQWTHLVGVYDPEGYTIKLYINSELIGQDSMPGPMRAEHSPRLYVAGSAYRTHEAMYDEVEIYDRALTDGEICTLYSHCRP